MDTRIGFGSRLLAALLDAAVILVLTVGIGGTLGGLLGGGAGRAISGAAGDGAAAGAAIGVLVGAVFGTIAAFSGFTFLYSLIEAFTGASPGKMVLRLKVGLEDGRPARRSVYAKRWAVKYSGSLLGLAGFVPGLHPLALLAAVAGVVIFIGCFLVLGDKRQALHDLAARTAVYRKSALVPP